MHAFELLPVASIAAESSESFVRIPFSSTSTSLQQYWSASRRRLDIWLRAFADAEATACCGNSNDEGFSLASTVEEVLLSEVLTRVWAGVAFAHDRSQDASIVGPVARSIYLGHQEARNRALLVILKGVSLSESDVRRLNVLRQKCERWTDVLLAQLPDSSDREQLAFDVERMREFARDISDESPNQQAVNSLTMASLKSAAQRGATSTPLNGVLNRQIAAGVLACLPADAFDAQGLFTTLWQSRIEHATEDTIELVQELLALD